MARKRNEIFTAQDQNNIAEAHRKLTDAAVQIGKAERCGHDCNDLKAVHQQLMREIEAVISEFLLPEGAQRTNEATDQRNL